MNISQLRFRNHDKQNILRFISFKNKLSKFCALKTFILKLGVSILLENAILDLFSTRFETTADHRHCTKKTKFLIKDFFIKSDQIRSFLWIW